MSKSIRTPGRHYHGNYWAIVMGHKDRDCAPLPLLQYIATPDKKRRLADMKAAHPGRFVRAILQPNPPIFERGM